MTKPLSVLIVGEVESDTQLILRTLKKGGFKPAFEQVNTPVQMRRALKNSAWDVVLSAFALPKLDGPTALKLLQESGLDTPFIIVSDSLGEEAAVGMLKAGACDCVPKENLKRIVPVVERELRRAADREQGKQLEAALRESEEKWHSLVNATPDYVALHDPEGRYLYLNHYAKGFTEKDVIGASVYQYISPESVALFREKMEKAVKTWKSQYFEHAGLGDNGARRIYEEYLVPMHGKNQEIEILGVARDITARKQGQEALSESEDKFKYAFDHSVTGKSVTLPSGEIDVNRALGRMLGYSQAELKNRKWQEITHSGDLELTQRAVDKLVSGEKDSVRFNKRYLHKNGSIVWADVGIAIRRDKEGDPLYYITSINDITEQVRSEEALRALTMRQEAILAAVPDILMQVDQKKGYTWANLSGLEFFGKDVIGKKADYYFEGEQDIYKEIAPLFKGVKDVIYLESWQRRKDGEKRLLAWWCRVLKDMDGKVTGALSSAHDITEVKRTEELLREAEERYKLLFESAPLAINVTRGTQITYANPSYLKMFGLSSLEELRELAPMALFSSEARPRIQENIQRRAKGLPVPAAYETECMRKDGTKFPVLMYVTSTAFADGPATVGFILDITERKLAEEALQQSEEKYRQLTERSVFGVFIIQDAKMVYVNPSFAKMFGYSPREIIGRLNPRALIHPEDVAAVTKSIQERLAGKNQTGNNGYKGIKKDGSIIYMEVHGMRIDYQGKPAVMGTLVDITERKRSEQQREMLYQVLRAVSGLLELENIAGSAVETIVRFTGLPHVSIALPDENGTHWVVRGAAGKLAAELGATYPIHKGVIGNAFKTGQTQWVRDNSKQPGYVNDVKKPGGPALRSEFVALMRSGSDLLGALNVESDRVDAFDNADVMMIQSAADIISLTLQNARLYREAQQEIIERKRVEQALQESEERFRVIYEKANDGVMISNDNNKIVDVNPRYCEMLGYSRAELLKMHVPDVQAPEVRQSGSVLKTEIALHGNSLFEGLDIDRNGRRIPVEISVGHVELPSGGLYVSVVRDITERKQTQTLQEAVYRIAAAADTTRSLEDLYPQIHQIILSVMPAENFYITLYDESQNLLLFPYFKDAEDEPLISGLQPAKGLTAYVLRTGKSLLCTQAVHDELERRGKIKLLGLSSAIWLGVPLVVEGKTIGAMVVQHYTDPQAYGEREQDMLEFVSTQVAIAINRKRAEEEILSLNADLEQRVVERTRQLQLAQEKIFRQEKLAMLGQLAGGVGHELRNPLGIISNAIYYLKYIQPDADEKVRQYHAMIEQEVHTSEKIITDLLDFARLDSTDRELLSVRELVQRTLTRFAVPESIQTSLEISEDLPKVFADLSQMEQVLGNLTVNACQAMASLRSTTDVTLKDPTTGVVKGGVLTISARRQKGMVGIAVKDTGTGITPENMARIFEPLFTTKSKGIGLGLAVSRKLAEANGGRIEVKSELGRGSTFTLFLPVEGK